MITLAKNVQDSCPILSNRNEARQLFHWDLHSSPAAPPPANLISSWCSQSRPAGRQSKCGAQRCRQTGSVPRRPGQDENQYFNSLGLGNTHIKSCPLRTQTLKPQTSCILHRLIGMKCLTHRQKCTHYSCTFLTRTSCVKTSQNETEAAQRIAINKILRALTSGFSG